MSLLLVDDVRVRFGGVMALGGVSVSADEGRVTGLIGPNGAGKTTLFNVITGLQAPNGGGRVTFADREISGLKPHRRARLGIARTFQRLELFRSMTVTENVRLAAELSGRDDPQAVTDELLDRLGISGVADSVAGEVPTGTARLVELGRALATSPRLLLLDEPASGLGADETEALGAALRAVAADGIAVLLVEHDMSLVMTTCDQVFVLDLGQIIAQGTPAAVAAHPAVIEAYLGAAS